VRHGVRAALESSGFEVGAETHSLRDALGFAASLPAGLVVVGVSAGQDPCDAVRRLKALPEPPITLVLVSARFHGSVAALIAAGADALVPRSVRPDELVDVAERVLDGDQVVAPVLQRLLVGTVDAVGAAAGIDAGLSTREREVLTFLAAGRTNREIAGELSLSLATVKSHLVHVYAKLGVRDRADAVHAAVVRGLLA
jgi:DNA-binding NarL/FixJ family response regulator